MHRYVWMKSKGKIPPGLHIHHLDGDKDNNDISNLSLITPSDHMKLHAKDYIGKNKEKFDAHLNNIRPLASTWHQSEEGRNVKSQIMKKYYNERDKIERQCKYCRKIIFQIGVKEKQFCGKGCRASFARGSIYSGKKNKSNSF